MSKQEKSDSGNGAEAEKEKKGKSDKVDNVPPRRDGRHGLLHASCSPDEGAGDVVLLDPDDRGRQGVPNNQESY